jgi:hypothetical protein
VCTVANYGALDRDVRIRMRDGRTGELVEPVLDATLSRFAETGIHHDVVPPDGSISPAHPVVCQITVPVEGLPVAANGGEVVECR